MGRPATAGVGLKPLDFLSLIVDCFVAMIAGLVNAQMSNDPGGNRWVRHLDRLIDLYLDDADRRRTS